MPRAGAFQAAKNRAMKRRVMIIIPTGPPEMKRVKRSVNGNMAKHFWVELSGSEFLVAKVHMIQS